MFFLRVQVTIPMDSGIPADAATNTWHFTTTDASRTNAADEIITALSAFYSAIDNTLFASVVASPLTVKVYDMADATPRVPILTGTIAVTPATGDPLPSQVACVLSFKAATPSGVAAARRRGRLFIGPLAASTISTSTGYARPSAAMRDVLRDAAQVLVDSGTSTGNVWAVYSPSEDASETLANSFHAVVAGWVDDRYDTQRRRLPDPTVRDTFAVA